MSAGGVPGSIVARTARYTSVGAICAFANNALLILGDLAGAHYVPMSILAFTVVTPLGYLLHSVFTFREPLSLRNFLRFTSAVSVGLMCSFLLLATLCTGLSLPVVVAAPVTTILVFLWNYVSAHWAIRQWWSR